jgi:putative flippase GtrA
VDIIPTAVADLRGVVRLARGLATGRLPLDHVRSQLGRAHPGDDKSMRFGLAGQVLRFAGIGLVSTVAYLLLYVVLRAGLPAQSANALALLTTAIGNTAANRRLTFSVRGQVDALRHHVKGLVVFGLALGITAGALAALHAGGGTPGRGLELLVLVLANLVATALRFLLLRAWVFAPRTTPRTPPSREQAVTTSTAHRTVDVRSHA